MTSFVQLNHGSISRHSLPSMRSNFVELHQHFPTKEIFQERNTKSPVQTVNIRHGENCHSLFLDPNKTAFSRNTENGSKSMEDEKKFSSSATQPSTHSEDNIASAPHKRRRVIRVFSLNDRDFLPWARRSTPCNVDGNHSSSVSHEKTTSSTYGENVPSSTSLTRLNKTQTILSQPSFSEANVGQARMDTFEEVSRKSENRVRVKVKMNLLPHTTAIGCVEQELSCTDEEILTFEKVQDEDRSTRGAVKSFLTDNEGLTNLKSMEKEEIVEVASQWKRLETDYVKENTPEKQFDWQTQMADNTLLAKVENRNSSADVVSLNGWTTNGGHKQLESDILPVTGATNAEYFDLALPNEDRKNVESFSPSYNLSSHNLDFTGQSNEASARTCEFAGEFESSHEIEKGLKNSFADADACRPIEKKNGDACLQRVTNMAKNPSQCRDGEPDNQIRQPIVFANRETHMSDKQQAFRGVIRAATISTMNEEIAETIKRFTEVTATPGQGIYDGFTQFENNLIATGLSCKDGVHAASGEDLNDPVDSSRSLKTDVPQKSNEVNRRANGSFNPRLWRMPAHRPLLLSNTVLTDDRRYLRQLSNEVRTMLILDARRRKISADEIDRRTKVSPEESQLNIDIEPEKILSGKPSKNVIRSRYLDSADVLKFEKFETLQLEDREVGSVLNRELKGEVEKAHKETLKAATRSEQSAELHARLLPNPGETLCARDMPYVTDSVVVHEFSELISVLTTPRDLTSTGSEEPSTRSFASDGSRGDLCESGDMLAQALKGMVILAASEQYMKQIEAIATAEYEALRRRPRKDGKVFLPRRSLHQNSLPEKYIAPLSLINLKSEEN